MVCGTSKLIFFGKDKFKITVHPHGAGMLNGRDTARFAIPQVPAEIKIISMQGWGLEISRRHHRHYLRPCLLMNPQLTLSQLHYLGDTQTE